MKKTATAALLFTFIFAAISPTFAQLGRVEKRVVKDVEQTGFERVTAMTDGLGVLVRWQMRTETSVAGYNIYRVSADSKEIINPTLVAGSVGRYGDRTAYGETREFYDTSGEAGFTYIVEGRRMDGSGFISKEIAAVGVKNLEAVIGTSSETYLMASRSTNSSIEERSSSLNGELEDIVSLHEQTPDPVNQLVVASKSGAKIAVKKDGFYRVTSGELQTANFPINSDSSKWRLFMNGVEQAIIVGPSSQYIEFYGRGVETPETDTRIYYLIADTVAGKRITTKVLRSLGGAATAIRYPVLARKKERTNYHNKLFNGEDENFLGRIFSDVTTAINFNLTAVDLAAPTVVIKVNLYGFSNNHHEVRPRINGNELPLAIQDGLVFYSVLATVPTSFLQEGGNVLELTSRAGNDLNYFDSVEVNYSRKFIAEQNKISFFTPGYKKVDITGFTTSGVRVFDLTFEGNPVLLANVPVVEAASGFTAKLPSSRTMVGYAVEDTALLQSPSITENRPSTLDAAANAADMLIISHSTPSFSNAAENWASYRRSAAGGSLSVKVIDVADVFDEYSYGRSGYAGMRSFLERATTDWQTRPRYVLFIGDSTYDPRNYEGFGFFNLIPSQSVSLILEESVSDEALGDFDDDGLSEIAIGRIPARTAAQINTALNKTIRYELVQQSFSRGVGFAHDVPLGFDFENMSFQLNQELPPGTPSWMVSAGDGNAHGDLINRINEGPFLINYSGHGAAGLWANSSFFNNFSVPELTNINNPSVFSMLTCLNGYFLRTNAESLSEVLLFSNTGGAAAAWASTSETTPDIQLIMGVRFFDRMSSGNIERMGDLVKDAKTAIDAGADVRLSWVLLGDPALKLP